MAWIQRPLQTLRTSVQPVLTYTRDFGVLLLTVTGRVDLRYLIAGFRTTAGFRFGELVFSKVMRTVLW